MMGLVVGFPRKKSKSPKYLLVMILGALLIKSIIFPLAFKVMAAMTGISVLMSGLGLIISSIVGFSKTVNAKTSDIKFRLENKSEDVEDYRLDNPLKISYDYNRF